VATGTSPTCPQGRSSQAELRIVGNRNAPFLHDVRR
jgi:hypothetical protein